MSTKTQTWTSQKLLNWTTSHFEKNKIDCPRLSAELLLAHVLKTQRLKLYMEPMRQASEEERTNYRKLVERAVANEPVDYLIGHTPFFALELKVSKDVLIPRPSTETLVQHVIEHSRRTVGFENNPYIADICTGSGAIAIAVAKNLPGARVIATDISPQALEIAKFNAKEQGVDDRIDFHLGDLYEPLPAGQRFQYILSNPPYISDEEWKDVLPNVKDFEPHLALRAKDEGLEIIKKVIAQSEKYLSHPGQLCVEISSTQKQKTLDITKEHKHLKDSLVLNDHEGLPRIFVADSVSSNVD